MPLTLDAPAESAPPPPIGRGSRGKNLDARPSGATPAPTGAGLEALELPSEKGDLPSQVVIVPQVDGRWVVAAGDAFGAARAVKGAMTITIEPAFEHLCPPLTKGELAALAGQVVALGRCKDPLLVWRRGVVFVLLDGHNRLWICLVLLRAGHPIPFALEIQEFADEQEARRATREAQSARRNLSDLAAAYFRGKEYLALKGTQGGDHKSKSKGHNVTLIPGTNAAALLAQKYEVAERTIKRDGELATAVDLVVETCGRRAGDAIMDRDGGVTCATVLWLAKLEQSEMRNALDEYFEKGRFPKRSKDEQDDEQIVWLRTEPLSLAARQLFEFLGRARAKQFIGEPSKLCDANGRPAAKRQTSKKLGSNGGRATANNGRAQRPKSSRRRSKAPRFTRRGAPAKRVWRRCCISRNPCRGKRIIEWSNGLPHASDAIAERRKSCQSSRVQRKCCHRQ
ncbi:MAG TPA: hypothetical protein VGY52_09410, partial [Roseiarcus sp.]|nr:hypothetical protein [Roseiarcus sp.]